jgi:hypothetical protein
VQRQRRLSRRQRVSDRDDRAIALQCLHDSACCIAVAVEELHILPGAKADDAHGVVELLAGDDHDGGDGVDEDAVAHGVRSAEHCKTVRL